MTCQHCWIFDREFVVDGDAYPGQTFRDGQLLRASWAVPVIIEFIQEVLLTMPMCGQCACGSPPRLRPLAVARRPVE